MPTPSQGASRNASGVSAALSSLVEKLLFRPVTIVDVQSWDERFRAIEMEGPVFKTMKWDSGQTIQLFLGNLTKRAYTPVDVRPENARALFLCYVHGQGPGSNWAASAQPDSVCHVMRPKESIDFVHCKTPSMFFGDETSLSSVLALQRCQGSEGNYGVVLEVDSLEPSQLVLDRLGIAGAHLVKRTSDGAHLQDVASKLIELAGSISPEEWIFTGNARSIQTVRKHLKRTGIPIKNSQSRAYWSPGKTGLD